MNNDSSIFDTPGRWERFKGRNNRVRVLDKSHAGLVKGFPSFSATGSIRGMKAKFYGKDALLVRCGAYIYNVTSDPSIYEIAN
jgi:hypothetical protein